MSGLYQPTAGLEGRVVSFCLRVGGHLALTGFHLDDPRELQHVALP